MERYQPDRVLHVVSAMNRGGTETLLMNVYRELNRSKLQFDFISHREDECEYDKEIMAMGGRIIYIPSLGKSGPFTYVKLLREAMENYPYKAVHIHTDFQSGLPALAAKLARIPVRICHSHSTNWNKGNGIKASITLRFLKALIKFAATDYCACSDEAGWFLFGYKPVKEGKVRVIHNGIPVQAFLQTGPGSRIDVRKQLEIPESASVIGHVGTFSSSKNQVFILHILKQLLVNGHTFYAVFAGDGPMRKTAEETAAELGIQSYVRFAGIRGDIPQLMKSFDIFVFPSLFEGFGMVTLEAQCAGTPCIAADTVPVSTDMGLGLMTYAKLDKGPKAWSELILETMTRASPEPQTIFRQFSIRGFNITESISEWLSIYGDEKRGAHL
ncbi:glycosyltransferase family 1 protein [Paenibacillus humicola]|uniref:glycosyltransferase family 1 protein n=1 Tax=Paenibacillus humicola TaxID=3110540 RepID=UPI00237A50DB|nr:glycosyltransferase family 1 protein [Paenibacillus humicola]